MATSAGIFTVTSAFNTVATYNGVYRGTLLNTAVFYFLAVPSPRVSNWEMRYLFRLEIFNP